MPISLQKMSIQLDVLFVPSTQKCTITLLFCTLIIILNVTKQFPIITINRHRPKNLAVSHFVHRPFVADIQSKANQAYSTCLLI